VLQSGRHRGDGLHHRRSVRQAKRQLQMEHALEDSARAREQALTHTDDPYR